jgi:hypothetical protein
MIALIAKAPLALQWSKPDLRMVVPNVKKSESTRPDFQ